MFWPTRILAALVVMAAPIAAQCVCVEGTLRNNSDGNCVFTVFTFIQDSPGRCKDLPACPENPLNCTFSFRIQLFDTGLCGPTNPCTYHYSCIYCPPPPALCWFCPPVQVGSDFATEVNGFQLECGASMQVIITEQCPDVPAWNVINTRFQCEDC